MSRSVKLVLTCGKAECGMRADYSGAVVSRFRKGEDGAEAVAEDE